MKTNAHIGLTVALFIAVSLATGCKSGGSKWAWWNPMSRSAADTSLVARTAPALPSDAATPLIEGVAPSAGTAIASTATPNTSATTAPLATTPPAMPETTIPPAGSIASSTPSQEAAKLAATPQISAPAATPYAAPSKTMTPADAYASAGPYNPNAYQPSAPAQVQVSAPAASDNRYGNLGNRYASTTPSVATEAVPDFSKPATPATPATPDRYGMGGRYASAPAPVTPPVTPAPAAPATTAVAATTPPPVTPVASESNTPAVVGTLPATSVYSTASTVPTTVPASDRSEIRLTSLPGEYRPGGTGTYKADVSVATRPGTSSPTSAPSTTPPVTTPRYR